MPARKRKRREPTHDWQKIQHYTLWPEQEQYEKLRPIVLFGQTAAERAKETGASERTLLYQASLFEQEGMASLFPKPHAPDPSPGRSLPPEMCQLIVNLSAMSKQANHLVVAKLLTYTVGHPCTSILSDVPMLIF